MQYRQLGKTDIQLSEIGLGTMSLPLDQKKATAIVDAAQEKGVNYFDTADLYKFGEIEELLNPIIKGRRDDFILASKGGNHWDKGKKDWFWDPSKSYIKSACKSSLKRLGTDYIDVYQLHGGTIEDPIDETIEAFQELKQEGLIREWGISSIRPNVIKRYADAGMSSVMMQYSLLDRRPEEELLDFLHEKGISVIVRGPVAKGMLSMKTDEKVPEDGFLGHTRQEVLYAADAVQLIRGKESAAQVAIQYVLQHPAVTSVTAGASTPEQVFENIGAAELEALTEEEYKRLQNSVKTEVYQQHRN
ncbi:aryl-alcohol dehydrogenase-like predicted oxidoreductase [Geomicrobium halophilum]|uniref:Aryl-alcohol dehydrogenase-like predicted oxidoreductase n=1 Tax=Geomicrobium halophilum TaxID=549000 RepID=A0A841PQR2_9BACL|nr:aldo/keto reductase [Geomicrobium halophilum]MBB6451217.1 aryl-alcohol dehydrogenase-like predicted oxidoreductase [Geomicrobium halophilum]